jgi:membrane associated rhomboid family serine protease
MLPLKDLNPTRVTPLVTYALVLTNVAVWLFYELPSGLAAAVDELGYHPCEVNGSCPQIGQGWLATAFTSMFMHGSWSHLIGNMLFLWIFGNNVEEALGHMRFLVFYLLGGVAAIALQTFVTLRLGTELDSFIPNVGASGAIAAVLGAYVLLYPRALVLTWVFPVFFFPIPAVFYLGIWFVFQLLDGGSSFLAPQQGGGVAYFAHIGGFVFGVVALSLFMIGRPQPGDQTQLRPRY